MKSEATWLSREILPESERRADWLVTVSHIYLDFLLAQTPRWAGCSVRDARSEREGGEQPVRFPVLHWPPQLGTRVAVRDCPGSFSGLL